MIYWLWRCDGIVNWKKMCVCVYLYLYVYTYVYIINKIKEERNPKLPLTPLSLQVLCILKVP